MLDWHIRTMTFNAKEIHKELFELNDSKLTPAGLLEYANNIGKKLGVEYIFGENTDGSQWERPEYHDDKKTIYIPIKFLNNVFTENELRAAKGAIDHEAGHAIWIDNSFLPQRNKKDKDKTLIWDIGNIIDDIRVECKMVKEFGVDKNNFRCLADYTDDDPETEAVFSMDNEDLIKLDDDSKMVVLVVHFYWMVSDIYRGIKGKKICDKMLFLKPKLISIIDDFVVSDDKAADTARKILALFGND